MRPNNCLHRVAQVAGFGLAFQHQDLEVDLRVGGEPEGL